MKINEIFNFNRNMKKSIKIFSLFALIIVCFFSCDNNDDLGFLPSEELGWIQFVEGEPDVIESNQSLQEIVRVGVNIQVPTTSSDLTINYNLVSVSGMDPNNLFSNTGSIISPAGETSYSGPDNNTGIDYAFLPTIDFDVSEIATNLIEPMVFDVILTGTSSSMITVGLMGENFPIIQRVSICPSFDSSVGKFIGDYILTVPSGFGPFGEQFTNNQIVTLYEGADGAFSRTFQADYLPAIGVGLPVVDIEFSFIDGEIIINDDVSTGVGCTSEILLGGDSNNILSQPCGDASIILNMLDFQGGSGGCGPANVPITVELTKV